jgi:uncharacterized membrane protein YccC
MNKTIPLLILLILIATALLLIISSALTTTTVPSPFLIAATIVSSVALFGALFSLYAEKRAKTRIHERNFIRKR